MCVCVCEGMRGREREKEGGTERERGGTQEWLVWLDGLRGLCTRKPMLYGWSYVVLLA